MQRLSQPQIKPYRIKLLSEQGGLCALCGKPVKADEAVLDHCHKSGVVRGVLHRGCNSMLGKVENHMAVALLTDLDTLDKCLSQITGYIKAGQVNEKGRPFYPSHRTEDEKRLLRNKRARQARAKTKAAQ